MLVLDATTKSIVVAMSGAAATTNPDFTSAYADNNGTNFTEGANDGSLNGTASVTLVSAPASSTRRTVKSITIENRDTAVVTLTISYNNNSTLRTIAKVTLNVGDTWTFDGTFDTYGSLKNTGYGTLSQQNANAVTITGGTISGTTMLGYTGNLVSKTANYTAVALDETILASSAASSVTITLPTAAGISGKIYTIKKTDSTANTVIIATTSSQTIDGFTTKSITYQYDAYRVQSDGSNWSIVAMVFGRNGTAGSF